MLIFMCTTLKMAMLMLVVGLCLGPRYNTIQYNKEFALKN